MCHVSFVMCHLPHATCHVSCFMCHMSCVACHLSPVTCHLSLTPTVTATDPSHANSPTMQSRLFCKDPKIHKISKPKNHWNGKNPKTSRGMPILAICFVTRSLQSTGKWGFQMWTDRYSNWHRDWISLGADSMKIRSQTSFMYYSKYHSNTIHECLFYHKKNGPLRKYLIDNSVWTQTKGQRDGFNNQQIKCPFKKKIKQKKSSKWIRMNFSHSVSSRPDVEGICRLLLTICWFAVFLGFCDPWTLNSRDGRLSGRAIGWRGRSELENMVYYIEKRRESVRCWVF